MLTSREFRLASGLVLLTFLALHLLNHALAVISFDLAENGLAVTRAIWRSWPGTILLYSAAAVHVALALRTLYERRHWDLPPLEWLRLIAGFTLPTLLLSHAMGARIVTEMSQVNATYHLIVASIIANGSKGWQFALLAPGWLHGCLGAWIGLRKRSWAQRAKPLLLLFAIGLPILSAIGFAEMSAAIEVHDTLAPSPDSETQRFLGNQRALAEMRAWIMTAYFALIGGAIAVGQIRHRLLDAN